MATAGGVSTLATLVPWLGDHIILEDVLQLSAVPNLLLAKQTFPTAVPNGLCLLHLDELHPT